MECPKEIFQTELMWPVVKGMKALDGKAVKSRIQEVLIVVENFGSDLLDIPHGDKSQTEFEYQFGWALTRLKYAGLVENPEHATWALTPESMATEEKDIDDDLKKATNKPPQN